MNGGEQQYLDLLKYVLENGVKKEDRTGTGTYSVFGRSMRFDLNDGFPLYTTKKVHFKSVIYELLWFLRGDTNIKYLKDNGVRIWDEWADENGDLGSVYGAQWRRWESKDGKIIDQIKNVVASIKNNPDSRRHMVSAWNVGEVDNMALPPCHYCFQFYVANGKLSCLLNIRSNDLFLGNSFNTACYSLLTHMIASICGLGVGDFIMNIGDAHIYSNHIEQVELQLTREPRPFPKLIIKNNGYSDPAEFKFEDIELVGYYPHPAIKGKVAV